MWILKSREEYKEDCSAKLKELAKKNLAFAIIFIVIDIIFLMAGCNGRNPHMYARSIDDIYEQIPVYLLIVILYTIFGTVISYIFAWKIKCDTCSCERKLIADKNCPCGGNYISMKKYKWTEESE